MSGLDNRYIAGLELEDYFVSNQNAEALAGGIVTFYKDNARTVKKLVYQLTQATPGVYSYVALPDPITLSGVGTFQNAGGDNIAVYYFPYDTFGNQELYYITVYDAFGNLQFTREAWPFPNFGSGGASIQTPFIGLTNQLSNPQFAVVNFIQGSTLTIPITGAVTTTVPIAPDWSLIIISTGNSSVTVTQMPQAGSSKLPYNPPFTLDFTISANISSVKLIQTLNSNPDWAAPQTTGVMGYLATSILLGAGTSVNIQYAPSSGTATQTLLNKTNTSGGYEQENATVQLLPGANPATGATGYDQIIISILNLPGTASISNVQVIPVTTNVSGVQYDQTPANRQIDHLFNYYNSLLQFKPIPSYLVGWDFVYNPAQFLGDNVGVQAIGANKSFYAWDQTIVFQSANSGLHITRGGSGVLGSFRVTADLNTQFAIIQYAPSLTAAAILYEKIAVNMAATTDMASIVGTISLWWTEDANLPSTIGSNNSIVATLDANGKPATFHGSWTEVPRLPVSGGTTSLQDAKFTLIPSNFNDYGFAGWDGTQALIANIPTYFAIVIGFATLTAAKSIEFADVSLCSGDIPTISSAKTADEVEKQCQFYYSKSFPRGVVPAQNLGTGMGEFLYVATRAAANINDAQTIYFPTAMNTAPTITFYSTSAATAQAWDEDFNGACTSTTATNVFNNGFLISCTANAGTTVGNRIGVQFVADSRLGQ